MCRSSFAQNRKKYFCHACQKHFANFFNQIFDETQNWKSFSIKNIWNWRLNLGKEMFLFDPKKVKQEYVFDDFWFLNFYFFRLKSFRQKFLSFYLTWSRKKLPKMQITKFRKPKNCFDVNQGEKNIFVTRLHCFELIC